MIMTRHACMLFLSLALTQGPALADENVAQSPASSRRPAVRVFNPTNWDGPIVVQVPVGQLGSTGLIDWPKVRVAAEDGCRVPHAIREGRPHWKASLNDPSARPRAEDLLTFSAEVKPHTWARFDVVSDQGAETTHVPTPDTLKDFSLGDLQATVSQSTGMVQQITWLGEALLAQPLQVAFSRTSASSSAARMLPDVRVSLAGFTTTEAMTALRYVLTVDEQLSMAVSYYFYASGLVEIWVDERPWQQTSPWVDHNAAVAWTLNGAVETLPLMENRAPFYGFKDYAAAVRHAACIHRLEKTVVVELGEETVNGRRWMRRLFCMPHDREDRVADFVEAADEGMIVTTEPVDWCVPDGAGTVTCPAGAELAAQRLSDAWRESGRSLQAVAAQQAAADAPRPTISLELAAAGEAPDIEGDGFAIHPNADGASVTVTARTIFGLMSAARQIAGYRAHGEAGVRVPLLASNPAVSLRAGGFGGGDFEVDFPHGSDAEWDEALEGLAASGMNIMADLGMWSNWKMPVSYRHMPELQSASPDAYDEVSGAKLSELDLHRQRGLRLLKFLHDRGVKVWLWLPVGCVPTTYAQQHPEAMAPGKPACPCFTHPLYNRYLEAFLTELLETYPIDGIVMIRDDNGGLCPCQRCREYVEQSSTKNAAWEQYLILYRWLRSREFRGDIAVYPYWDYYEPRLDPVLPADLLVVGHGSGATVLARNYERALPMGDTWLDNLFASFRVASTPRMRRLLADRNAFWIGGALRGSELPWQSIGRFGSEPSASVNSFRFQWATQQFGSDRALRAVALIDSYEELWELYDVPLLPLEWMKLSAPQRTTVSAQGRQLLAQFRQELAAVRAAADGATQDAWLRHADLFGVYFDYLLQRLELFSRMQELAVQNKQIIDQGGQLPEPARQEMLAADATIAALAAQFDARAADVPSRMLQRTRAMGLTRPYKEFVAGYDPSLDGVLQVKQFAGTLTAEPVKLSAGQPFTLRIRMRNLGMCPWSEGTSPRLELEGDTAAYQLPATCDFTGAPMAIGDQREMELHGVAPRESGRKTLHIKLIAPFRNPLAIAQCDVTLGEE